MIEAPQAAGVFQRVSYGLEQLASLQGEDLNRASLRARLEKVAGG